VPVVAFVNEGKLQITGEVDARIALLQQWVDAGAVLGNHTYSHSDFNKLTVEQFEDEIIKGEVVTRRLMQAHQPYQLYFRHPMTHTGDTQAKKEAIETLLQLLAPFAPHITEELWEQLGHDTSIHTSEWPSYDEQYLASDRMTIVVQINGKVRAQLEVAADATQEDIETKAKQDQKVASYLTDKQIKKTIYVPGKLISFVI